MTDSEDAAELAAALRTIADAAERMAAELAKAVRELAHSQNQIAAALSRRNEKL